MNNNNYEMDQRRRESEEPFWAKLKWLEDASRMAISLQRSPPLPPPKWVSDLLSSQQEKKDSGNKIP